MARYFNQIVWELNNINVTYQTLGLIQIDFYGEKTFKSYHVKIDEEDEDGEKIAKNFLRKYKNRLKAIETKEQYLEFLKRTKNEYNWEKLPGWWKRA